MSQVGLYRSAAQQATGAASTPILRSMWAMRRQPGTPDPWQRVIVIDMDDMGMVAMQPAAGASVTHSAKVLGFPTRWVSIATLLRDYEESPE